MNEPYPGRPDGYQPRPGGPRRPGQPVQWPNRNQPEQRPNDSRPVRRPNGDQPAPRPNDTWYRPRPGQERGPGPREAPTELGRPVFQPHRARRRPELDQTTVDQIRVDQIRVAGRAADQTAVFGHQRHAAARTGILGDFNLALSDLNWALVQKHWALIAGIVFFLVDTGLMVDGFASPVSAASRMLVIFIWLVSLVVLAVLWLRSSSRFSVQNPFVRAETGAHQR